MPPPAGVIAVETPVAASQPPDATAPGIRYR
ncbi:hypothetical protein QE392_002569 [Microbacterium proteolyticum]|nr:hypothetical protein [Microbacterium sp. SORGH_AS_0344]MDQ1170765.1 hypothetical protein [Microbacterium proteolyticum]